MEMMILTEAQCHALCDMGYFNTTIYGYMVEALVTHGKLRQRRKSKPRATSERNARNM